MTTTSHYNGSARIEMNEEKHEYVVFDSVLGLEGVRLDGVTGVTGLVFPKPELEPWKLKLCADHIVRNLGGQDEEGVKALVKAAKNRHKQVSQYAKDLGKDVHKHIEQDLEVAMGLREKIELSSFFPEFSVCIAGWDQFKRENDFTPLATEERAYSRKHSYVGTYDGRWVDVSIPSLMLEGKRVIVDAKTGSDLYPEYLPQLGAYWGAHHEEYPEDELDGTLLLHIQKDRPGYKVVYFDREQSIKAHEAFLNALNWARSIKWTETLL